MPCSSLAGHIAGARSGSNPCAAPTRPLADAAVGEQRFGVGDPQRGGEEEPLREVAADAAESGELLRRLDALAEDLHAQAAAEGDDGAHDLLLAGAETADEGAIDLERVDGELVQVRER